jgi:hypothetical protein
MRRSARNGFVVPAVKTGDLFLAVLLDLVETIHVALDREIEAPGIINPCLPYAACDSVLFGTEGRMSQTLKQE